MKPDQQNQSDALKTRSTLLSKVRRGDEEGWNHFYDLYEDFIYSAARGAGLSHEEAQDVIQDTMIAVRDYIRNFVPDQSRGRFRTWLGTIVRSRIADQYRKKKRNPLEQAIEPDPHQSQEFATSVTNRIPDMNELELDRLIDGKLQQAILKEARKLAKAKVGGDQYQAYDLFSVQEVSAAEVASSLGISAITVRVRAFRVRRVVNQEMRRLIKALETSIPRR